MRLSTRNAVTLYRGENKSIFDNKSWLIFVGNENAFINCNGRYMCFSPIKNIFNQNSFSHRFVVNKSNFDGNSVALVFSASNFDVCSKQFWKFAFLQKALLLDRFVCCMLFTGNSKRDRPVRFAKLISTVESHCRPAVLFSPVFGILPAGAQRFMNK